MNIPDTFFRTEVVHRYMSGTDQASMLGCGFMLKPGKIGQHVNSAFNIYSGVLVLRGEGRYVDWLGRTHRTFPGCYLQRLPGRRHSTTHAPDVNWAECYINTSRGFMDSLAALNSIDPDRPVLNPGLSLALVKRFDDLLRDLRAAAPAELPRLLAAVHGLIVDIYTLDRRQKPPGKTVPALDEAARRLAAGNAGSLYFPRLASELGLGYESFRKAFRARFGMSPGDYAIRRRMERARSLLAHGEMTVKEVAFALDYPNEFAFSRQFSKTFGAPPSRFRGMP